MTAAFEDSTMIRIRSGVTFDKLNLNKINNLTMNREEIEAVLHQGSRTYGSVEEESESDEDSLEDEESEFRDNSGIEF